MVLYEKKLYVALIVLLLVFLYYNFALEKLVEDEILEITEDKNELKEDSENTTEKLQETTETETASTTSATTTRKWLSDLVFISAYKTVLL
jgi:hypothetical protein